MKASFVRLALCASVLASIVLGQSAQAFIFFGPSKNSDTEIQVLVNYRQSPSGKAVYDYKLVSTWESPLSASNVYFHHYETPTNAACFWGEPDDALRLFYSMVEMFNRENKRFIQIDGRSYFDRELKKMALKIDVTDEYGQRYEWFPRMRQCNRQSTEDERHN